MTNGLIYYINPCNGYISPLRNKVDFPIPTHPQNGGSLEARCQMTQVTCDGQPFTVVSGDTCYAYQTVWDGEGGGWVRLIPNWGEL